MNDPHDELIAAEAVDAPVTPPAQPPRVWDVFVVIMVSLAAIMAAQVVAVIALMASMIASGTSPEEAIESLMQRITSPFGFMLVAGSAQLLIGLAALIGARFSPRFATPPLGMSQPGLPLWAYPVVMIGALLPTAIGLGLAELLAMLIPPDPTAAMLYEQMTAGWAIPFIIFIALAPGFMEEILFRGYMQRRLLRRWSPAISITITSIAFGLFHIAPHTIVFATIVGFWLGVIAWRTDPIWPTIACHAFINGIWNVWNIGIVLGYFPEQTPVIAYVIGAVVITGCFAWSAWLLWRIKPRDYVVTPDTDVEVPAGENPYLSPGAVG